MKAVTAIYLDHAASTPLRPGVAEAMAPLLSGANPSSGHRFGRAARKSLEDARDRIAGLLRCRPAEIVFTSGGTESDNLAILGLGRGVVTCATEHTAVLGPCRRVPALVLPPRADGRLDPAALEAALTPGVGLASVMWANNETGVIHPMAGISKACRAQGIPLHSDAVQAVGHVPVDLALVDLLTLTGHKLGGPRGCGALFVRQGVRLSPLMLGGEHEGGRRAGTENVAGAVGLAEALAQALAGMAEEARRLSALRERLLAALPGAVVNGHAAERLPQILNVSFPGIASATLVIALDQEGVAVSGGAACHTGSPDTSPVLAAMGLPRDVSLGAIRLSLGHTSTEAEVDGATRVIRRVVDRLSRK